jgi:F0F1-type ATP synthase assembly protein I
MATKPRPGVSALAAGFQFGVCVLLPLFIGFAFDRRHETKPWGTLGGLLLGLVIGGWSVFRPLWIEARQEEPAGRKKPPSPDDPW